MSADRALCSPHNHDYTEDKTLKILPEGIQDQYKTSVKKTNNSPRPINSLYQPKFAYTVQHPKSPYICMATPHITTICTTTKKKICFILICRITSYMMMILPIKAKYWECHALQNLLFPTRSHPSSLMFIDSRVCVSLQSISDLRPSSHFLLFE